jgi:hypothetical protein
MPTKSKAGLIGAIAVVAILTLQAVEHWTVVDAVLSGLRSKGNVGVFVANFLLSPVVPLVLAIAAIYLVFEGRKEKHELNAGASGDIPGQSEAQVRDSGNATATARIGDIHLHNVPTVPTTVPIEPDDPPILSFEDSLDIHIVSNGWVFVEQVEGVQILIAAFRNRIRGVGIPTPIAYRVSAHL